MCNALTFFPLLPPTPFPFQTSNQWPAPTADRALPRMTWMLLLWLGDWAAGSTCEYQHARVALMFAALFLLLSPAHHCVCYTIPPCSPSAQAFAAAARRLPFFGFCQQCELDHFSHIGPRHQCCRHRSQPERAAQEHTAQGVGALKVVSGCQQLLWGKLVSECLRLKLCVATHETKPSLCRC